MQKFLRRLAVILGSRGFFLATFSYFVFQAVWIALSAVYPQAFDEAFHFGLIKIYAHHWSPFLASQPPGGNTYGAMFRDPSYLYHYLMSFPYRLLALFFHAQTSLVIALRLIDIVLFSIGLVLFRRILLRARLSRAMTNILLLLFTLIPIVPQLAAHINYDNLLIPLTAWTYLLSFDIVDQLRKHQLGARSSLLLIAVGCLTSVVKYVYLPIFAATLLFLSLFLLRQNHSKERWKKLGGSLRASWNSEKRLVKCLLITLVIISFGLFFQRDGVNLLTYHTVTPECVRVLNAKDCSAYTVWKSDYDWHKKLLAHKSKVKFENPFVYIVSWGYWLWYRLFFAVNGPDSGYRNYPPLPLPSAAAAVLAIAGIVTAIIWRHRLFADPYLSFFLAASGVYLLALLIEGWTDYHYTNVLVDMNGRYLLPVLLPLAAIAARAFSLTLRRASIIGKAAIALAVILLFFQGGGFLTFISRSDASWDWPNSTVVKLNDAARDVTKPVIIRGSKNYSTHYWFFN